MDGVARYVRAYTWVRHDDEVMAEIVKLLVPPVNP
jgi:hypothetical protein